MESFLSLRFERWLFFRVKDEGLMLETWINISIWATTHLPLP